jgi:hypothetical protein
MRRNIEPILTFGKKGGGGLNNWQRQVEARRIERR